MCVAVGGDGEACSEKNKEDMELEGEIRGEGHKTGDEEAEGEEEELRSSE
jgi:hypothetical protein